MWCVVEHDRIKDADALTVPSGNMQITPSAMICQRFQNYFLIFGIVPKQKPQSGDFSLKIQSDCGLAPCIFCLCLFCPIILTFLLQQQCIKRLHRHRTVKQKALLPQAFHAAIHTCLVLQEGALCQFQRNILRRNIIMTPYFFPASVFCGEDSMVSSFAFWYVIGTLLKT